MVRQLEKDYERRKADEVAEDAEKGVKDEKLKEGDVFETDADFVTEVDDVPEVTAPELDEVEDGDESDTQGETQQDE